MINDILDHAPANAAIHKTIMTMNAKLDVFRNPMCSISGGADSDDMLDLVEMIRGDRPVQYAFFNTGMEYKATREHLSDLESKYSIEIQRFTAVVPVVIGCKMHGVPFLTKLVSEYIYRLQRHNFQWEDGPFYELWSKYPKCKAALRWWCNAWGEDSKFNIRVHSLLKDFIMMYPPDFPISSRCCIGAKEKTAAAVDDALCPDLKMIALRQAEGGQRSTAHSSCFSPTTDKKIATFRPTFFWKDQDKRIYEDWRGIVHSDAYTVYGLKRTGCACCPLGSRFEDELAAAEKFEPSLARAANSVFHKSYEYTRKYREFKAKYAAEEIPMDGQEMFAGWDNETEETA